MTSAGNFTSSYAKALLAATRQQDLAKPERAKQVGGITPEQMARMEREMESLQRDFKAIEANYVDEFLDLVIAAGFVGRLIGDATMARYRRRRRTVGRIEGGGEDGGEPARSPPPRPAAFRPRSQPFAVSVSGLRRIKPNIWDCGT